MNNIEAGPRDMVYNVKNYPDFIKAAPFCCWKQGKVPYNPITGKRAKVDETATFGTLEEAYRAYMGNSLYKGIGLKVSGRLGAIDLDKCVGDDVAKEFKPFALSSLSENAQKVLSMFPNAVVELSPSRTGLHLFFIVPEGFSFERDEYYINNRNLGIEVYFPEITNRFLTVTGMLVNTVAAPAEPITSTDEANKQANNEAKKQAKTNENKQAKKEIVENASAGSGLVSSDALQEFLDAFMKRPAAALVAIKLPEGGSILSDEEVKQKAARGKNGERFQSLYEGDWFKFGGSDVNWSQSEADIELCGILAFYCRGDINQMDRLFRASGLMRDKWDEARGDSTYGAITMNNAIANCHFFYNPTAEWEQQWEQQVEKFKATIDAVLNSAQGTQGTQQGTQGTQASKKEDIVEKLLAEDALLAASWAMENDPVRYVALRSIVPAKLGLRIYEKQVKAHKLPKELPDYDLEPLVLTGIETSGLFVPKHWIVNDNGISFFEDGVENHFAKGPLFVSGIQSDVDSGLEKLSVTFKRKGVYKTITAPRANLLNKNKIIDYADTGITVSSHNAPLFSKYIADFEDTNDYALVLKRCINRAGWLNDEFFPFYLTKGEVLLEDDENKTLSHLIISGCEEAWLLTASKIRKLPLARAMLAASFASPMLHKLGQRNIYYHSWANSKSGKTAALKFAMSVWGNPEKLFITYYSTIVGIENRAGLMKHLPLAIDELQSIDKRINLNNLVYTLGNGFGKPRGKAKGGNRLTATWNNCILSTGEQPITSFGSMDGVVNRLLEVYGTPIPDEKLGKLVHQVASENYGFAGPKFIKYLIEEVLGKDEEEDEAAGAETPEAKTSEQGKSEEAKSEKAEANNGETGNTRIKRMEMIESFELKRQKLGKSAEKLLNDLEHIYSTLRLFNGETESQFDNISVLALADYYSSISIFGLSENQAFDEAIALGNTLLENQKQEEQRDVIDRAWEFVCGWIAQNHSKFDLSSTETYGRCQDGNCYVISSVLKAALEEAGFSERKTLKGFAERGYLNTCVEAGKVRNASSKFINGQKVRIYDLNIQFKKDNEFLE